MPTNTTHNNVVSLADWRVRIRGSASHGSQEVECAVQELDGEGLVVDSAAELGRYAWVEVDLPDGTGVRALGEVVERRDPLRLAMEVRFKHLFPDHRARLLNALALQA